MHNRFSHLYLLLAIYLGLANYAHAGNLALEGNIGLWWNIYEQNENGIMQARTQEAAADVASGFNLYWRQASDPPRRARITAGRIWVLAPFQFFQSLSRSDEDSLNIRIACRRH